VRWGLVPSWAKDPKGGARMINARSESVAEKPAFRRAVNARRCLIPADGWYEWQRGPEHKQPYYTHHADGSSLAMAGIWEYWKPKDDPEGQVPGRAGHGLGAHDLRGGVLAQVHDRMPLLLPPSAWDAWLDPDTGAADDAVAALLAPPAPELIARLELRPVSPLVNSVRNNGPELLAPVAPEDVAEPLQLDLLAGPNPA
jgi:putative SOS response-associated peptidase YedK